MKSIIAVNNLGYIGLDNKLLWKSAQDMSHFVKMTINQRLLVGYNTAQDLPKLKNRTIIIDNRDELITDVDWCIGGKKTYEKYAPHFTELHISHIDDNNIGDIMFPDFRNLNPNCKIFNYYFK
jgi:dihydrofolate reductase